MKTPRSLSRVGVASALTLGLLLTALPAAAQTDEQRAGARSLATDGVAAFNEGRFADAADLFGKAESLVHAPTHLLFLARAQVKTGHFVKAREAYMKISREQLPPSAPQAFRDAQTAAPEELRAIEPKIGKLTVKVDGAKGATDLTLKIDGEPVSAVLIGASLPTDPGEHLVEVTAHGKKPASQKVKLAEAGVASVSLKLEDDPNAAEPAAVAAGGATQPGAVAPADPNSPPPSDSGVQAGPNNGMRIGSYVAFGVGVVGLGVGTLFLVQKGSKEGKLDKECTGVGGACPTSTKSLHDEANTAGMLSVVGFATGGVGIAAGVTLFLLSGPSSKKSASHVTPWVGYNSAGVSGVF